MALIRNGVGLSMNPMRIMAAPSFYGIARALRTPPGAMRGFDAGEATVISGASISDTAARPNGYDVDGWLLARRGGGFSCYNNIVCEATMSGEMQMGINLLSTATSDGGVSSASLSMVVSLACSILADCAVTATMQAVAGLAATLSASGDVAGALSVIAFMICEMTADATLDGSNLRGESHMTATLTSAGSMTAATPAEIAAAVWADLSAVALLDDAELVRKTTGNRLEVDITTSRLNLYDDDGVTVMRWWPLATDGGEAVTTATGIQTKRGVPV